MRRTFLFAFLAAVALGTGVPWAEGSRAVPRMPAMGQLPTKSLFGKRPVLTAPVPVGPKTNDVWFTANGVPTHSVVQGQILTWAANCLTNDTLRWDIWVDVNGNGQLDTTGPSKDNHLASFLSANGDTTWNWGFPDTTHIPDNQVVNRLKCILAPALHWFRATSIVDNTWAIDTLRVHPLPSPWATVSGQVQVPGNPALQAGLLVEAVIDDMPGWMSITDHFGNYVINFDNEIQNQVWEVGGLDDLVGAWGAYVAPPDTHVLVTAGPHPGVNFTYLVATDSITGDVTRHPSGSLPFEPTVWCQKQDGREKYTETVNGHYRLFFAARDTGRWNLGLWWDEGITGYMRPGSRNNLQPVGAGHLVENFTIYPADVTVQGTVTENSGPPSRRYLIAAWSENYRMWNQTVSQAVSGNYSLPVSDVESQYSIFLFAGDSRFPIPPGWIVSPQNYYPVDPPAIGLNFNLTPATEFIEGQITQDPGDAQPIDYNQTWVHAWPTYGGSGIQIQPNMSGQYSIPVAPNTYNVFAWCNRFLFKPSQYSFLVVNPGDTLRNKNFLANFAHCRVVVNLVGYPAGHTGWVSAGDASGWPNSYQAYVQVNGPGTHNLYICNSDGWSVWAPGVAGYDLSPYNYYIGNITHADTIRGPYTFTYTPTGVAGRPEAPALPKVFALNQNKPNPVTASTSISFHLPRQVDVSLIIYNIQGQEVKRWHRGAMEPGYHTIVWDGTDKKGTKVSAGVYFYRLQAGDFTATRRMSVLR